MKIQEQEDAILAEYSKIAFERHDNYVVNDGLPFCGKIIKDGCNWKRTRMRSNNNEGDIYERMPLKILLITKECPVSSETKDLRIESFRDNNTQDGSIHTINMRFHHNILSTIWGLTHYDLIQKKCPDWEDKEKPWSWDMAREFFETMPIPRINVKKIAGNNTTSQTILDSYMYDIEYRPLIIKQILLYNADIIVCYGRQIFEFVINPANGIFNDVDVKEDKKLDPWVYYSGSKQKLIFNSIHPSYWGVSEKDFYNGMMTDYSKFLNTHEDLASKWFPTSQSFDL